jgi:hypothetical protein
VYFLVFHAYINETRGSTSKIPSGSVARRHFIPALKCWSCFVCAYTRFMIDPSDWGWGQVNEGLFTKLWNFACLSPPYFSKFSHQWGDIRGKVTDHKICALIYSTTFVWNISHSKKDLARCHKFPSILYVYVSIYVKCMLLFFVIIFSGSAAQRGLWHPRIKRFLDHTQRRATFGRTRLDEWSARRWYLYLTTHTTNIHAPGGIRSHNRSRWAAVDLRRRPRGHSHQQSTRYYY